MSGTQDPYALVASQGSPGGKRVRYSSSSSSSSAAGGGGYRKGAYVRRRPKMRVSRFKFRSAWDTAGLTETRSLVNPQPGPLGAGIFLANTVYNIRDIAIDQFRRASTVAAAYSQYVITGCTFKFYPLADTFSPAGGISAPRLYWMLDKSGALPNNITINEMKNMGAQPCRMDESTVTIKWRPYTLGAQASAVNGATSNGGAFPAGWLSTNGAAGVAGAPFVTSSVDHFGMYFCMEQDLGQAQGFRVDLVIDVKYRKPLYLPVQSGALSLAVLYDEAQLVSNQPSGA